MAMIWNSGMGTPMPGPSYEPGREYTPSSVSQTFSPSSVGANDEVRRTQSEADKWIAYAEKAGQIAAEASRDQNVWEREKLQMQYADAKRGRDNAIKLAQVTAEASRYGVDQARKTALDQLRETQRQFDANHALDLQKFGLEQQKFGLNVAEDYTKYASTPDLTFQRADLMEGLQRAGIGSGPAPYGVGANGRSAPVAKTWNDWAALQGWATPTVQAGQTQPGAGAAASPGAGAQPGAGTGTDPRITASNAIMKAVPPSDAVGHDQSDFAALNAIRNLYLAPRPGAFQKLRPGQQAAVGSGLSRLGYYAPDAIYDIKQAGIGQGSARSA